MKNAFRRQFTMLEDYKIITSQDFKIFVINVKKLPQ